MRNTVTFQYPAPLIVVPGTEDVLSVEGAGWFLGLLGTTPGIELDQEVAQEDWGVAIFARHVGRRYWIGLSAMGEHEWLAHVHRHPFAWRQWFSPGGREARAVLVGGVDRALRTASARGLKWFDESDRNLRAPADSPE